VSRALEQYFQDLFKRDIENLLDDPSDLLHPGRMCEPAEMFEHYRACARHVGLDYDQLVDTLGTESERRRLRDIERGVIVPDHLLNLNYWKTPAKKKQQAD
jgi:hypothetical protein